MSTQEHIDWFTQQRDEPEFQRLVDRPIAYFCAEYALEDALRTYSGGLGGLAGDVVREAGDREIPLVAVGLYYHEGYICEDEGGGVCKRISPEQAGLRRVLGADGEPLRIRVPIKKDQVTIQAWEKRVGDVRVFFLDTRCEENNAANQAITDRLYVGNKEVRFQQEIVLGIGGLRMLAALGLHPSLYHLNEGHSSLLVFELTAHEMRERHLGFDSARQFARRRVVFTNHTLIAAGNDIFDNDLVSLMLQKYAEEINVPVQELIAIGLVHESSTFSMTMLSLRMASIVNAVSELHAKEAKSIWSNHPMAGITNGIHISTWDALDGVDERVGSLWRAHMEQKKKLLRRIKEETGEEWDVDTLLLGWARRIALYKRPLAVLEEVKRFAEIAADQKRPCRLAMAGIPHEADEKGHQILARIQELAAGELKGLLVYLSGYTMEESKMMTAGCDVWINTPVVGYEACGTSGMKASLNGVLAASTKDGWMAESPIEKIGWELDSDDITNSFLTTLEKNIVPLYYEQTNGIPEKWEEKIRTARALILDRFSATRMLRQYLEMLYL